LPYQIERDSGKRNSNKEKQKHERVIVAVIEIRRKMHWNLVVWFAERDRMMDGVGRETERVERVRDNQNGMGSGPGRFITTIYFHYPLLFFI